MTVKRRVKKVSIADWTAIMRRDIDIPALPSGFINRRRVVGEERNGRALRSKESSTRVRTHPFERKTHAYSCERYDEEGKRRAGERGKREECEKRREKERERERRIKTSG